MTAPPPPALVAAYRAGILAAFVARDGLLARKADVIRDGTGRPVGDPAIRAAWNQLRDEGVTAQKMRGRWGLTAVSPPGRRIGGVRWQPAHTRPKYADLQGF